MFNIQKEIKLKLAKRQSSALRRPLTLLFWLVKLQKRLLDARAQSESDAAESARKSAEAYAAASKADKLHIKQYNLLPKLAKPIASSKDRAQG